MLRKLVVMSAMSAVLSAGCVPALMTSPSPAPMSPAPASAGLSDSGTRDLTIGIAGGIGVLALIAIGYGVYQLGAMVHGMSQGGGT